MFTLPMITVSYRCAESARGLQGGLRPATAAGERPEPDGRQQERGRRVYGIHRLPSLHPLLQLLSLHAVPPQPQWHRVQRRRQEQVRGQIGRRGRQLLHHWQQRPSTLGGGAGWWQVWRQTQQIRRRLLVESPVWLTRDACPARL